MLWCQALLDLLAQFPSRECDPLDENLPYKEICSLEANEWLFAFDVSSTYRVGGAGVLLYAPDSTNSSLTLKLESLQSHNELGR